VHQGNEEGVKGVYHINVVDCMTSLLELTASRRGGRFDFRGCKSSPSAQR
jgi:hypothetical protein